MCNAGRGRATAVVWPATPQGLWRVTTVTFVKEIRVNPNFRGGSPGRGGRMERSGRNWLERSGQAWKMHAAEAGTFAMYVLFVIAFALPRTFRHVGVVFTLLVVAGLGAGMLNIVLPFLVRCRVCGARVNESEAALRLNRGKRLFWVHGLQACPHCGDDGLALPESREAWGREPRAPVQAYWNAKRLLIAGLGILAVFAVLQLAALYRVGPR